MTIHIHGARQNNLQNVDVDIPRGRLTGVSGSGKSSLVALRKRLDAADDGDKKALQDELETALTDVLLEHQGKLAAEFDKIHDVNRAVAVGSLDAVIPPARIRPAIIEVLDKRLR
jgi:excinuclease UvrABC ATPase subunit